MTLALVITAVSGILVGIVATLKVIAPATKNTVDDKILDYAEKAEAVVESIAPSVSAAASAPAAK